MIYNIETINEIVVRQRNYFNTNVTLDVNFRINQLKVLKNAILSHEMDLIEALNKDLGRLKLIFVILAV